MDTRSGLPWLGYGNDGKELPQRECESGQAGQPHRAWGGWQLPRAHRGYCVAATAPRSATQQDFYFLSLEVAGRAWSRCQSSEGVGRAEAIWKR